MQAIVVQPTLQTPLIIKVVLICCFFVAHSPPAKECSLTDYLDLSRAIMGARSKCNYELAVGPGALVFGVLIQ